MRRPKIHGARLLGIASLPIALVATAGIVSASSYSVFQGTTTSPNNSFSTGSVALTNDSNNGTQSVTGSALYTVTNITPTTPSTALVRCVNVQSTGSVPSNVRLYTQNTTTNPSGNTLAQYLKIQVEIGTVGSTCASFTTSSSIIAAGTTLATVQGFTNYATGKDTTWAPTGGTTETRAFRFTLTPDSAMPNTAQGQNTTTTFTWEADNT